MFGLGKPKLPVTEEERLWIDGSFVRLGELLGVERMRDAVVMLPTPEHFPDQYDQSEEALETMFRRVADRMQVDPGTVELQIFDDAEHTTRSMMPFASGESSGAGGLYAHDGQSRTVIAINGSRMDDPTALVATLAHELGHVILLRPGLVGRDEPDMELWGLQCEFRFSISAVHQL
jgi:hypothetical protein